MAASTEVPVPWVISSKASQQVNASDPGNRWGAADDDKVRPNLPLATAVGRSMGWIGQSSAAAATGVVDLGPRPQSRGLVGWGCALFRFRQGSPGVVYEVGAAPRGRACSHEDRMGA
jgi:hypothetical protein